MTSMRLVRFHQDKERTLGTLRVGAHTFTTVERPWIPSPAHRGGLNDLSCVPPGRYRVIPHNSQKYSNTYALINTDLDVFYQPGDLPKGRSGRTAILMHVGNRVQDVIGCIAVGRYHGLLYGEPATMESAIAMRELNALLGQDTHTLEIV
jgi:hypothetical protein